LDVSVTGEEASSVTVQVSYDCAFKAGKITVDLRKDPDVQGANIVCQPAQPVAVPAGGGEITFQASGTGGTTNWLIVGLYDTGEECLNSSALSPPSEYEPEKYVVDECAVWKIVEYHKDWPSEE
jgi:hypothetical protein